MSHYKPYPTYKDSGVEWLGQVPAHWEVKRLKYSANHITEKTDRRESAIALENIESWTGRFVGTSSEFEGEGVAFKLGDILFGKLRPYLAKVYLATITGEAVGDVFVIRPSSQIYQPFLQYQLLSCEFINMVDSSTYGAKMPRVSWEFFGDMPLLIPMREEQLAIAIHLDRETVRIDGLISRKNRIIELLREKRQALIARAVTKGLDPSAPMKNSGVEWLGDVPAHWHVTPLKYLATFRSGGTPSKENLQFWDGKIPWASAKDLKKDQLNDTSDHISDIALMSGGASLIPEGSILVVVRGMILARMFPVVEALVPMAINQDLKALKAVEEMHDQFLAYLLRGLAPESLRRLEEAGHGTKALRMDAWTSMQLTVPPLDEQKEILDFIIATNGRIDTLIDSTESSIELLKERRSALITAAVTGQIDLRETA